MTYRVDISGLDDLIEAIEEAKKLDGMTGEGEAMADYSAYVEYGTRYMYGRFYMKKGHTAAAKRFLDNMEALVK